MIEPKKFEFRYFGKFRNSAASEAQKFLNQKYPAGSVAAVAVQEVEQAGAKCQLVKDVTGEFYWCRYNQFRQGLTFYFFPMEWQVAINLHTRSLLVGNITVNTGFTAP